QRTMIAGAQGPAMHGAPPMHGQGGQPRPGMGQGMVNDPARTVVAMPNSPGGQMHGQPMMHGQRPGGVPMPAQQLPSPTPTTPPGGRSARPGAGAQVGAVGDSHGGPPIGVRQSAQQLASRGKKKRTQADALFWVLCIIAGILVGVIAYVLVAKVGH